jgi:low affinity Fe/Cu permease
MSDETKTLHPLLKNSSKEFKSNQSTVEKFCAWVCTQIGSPLALALVVIIQVVWIVIGQLTKLDPYPYSFLLTISNIIQLILIFVLAVGQRQTNDYNESRSKTDHESISQLLFKIDHISDTIDSNVIDHHNH